MMEIRIDDLSDPGIELFLDEHVNEMKSLSPPESKHALDLEGLRAPEVTFWSVWENEELIGCGALKELDRDSAEIKSMRITKEYRGKGLAQKLLDHIVNSAKQRDYQVVNLETGSMPFFEPARRLYRRFGFQYCDPFGEYVEDPNSVFMRLALTENT